MWKFLDKLDSIQVKIADKLSGFKFPWDVYLPLKPKKCHVYPSPEVQKRE